MNRSVLTTPLKASCAAVLFALQMWNQSLAQVLPSGHQVVAGQAVLSKPNANVLNIQNTPGSIMNWQSYSIGAGQTVNYQQQNSSSAVLNRVIGVDPSQILGQLQSNGKVFLINPNGIVFGQGAKIDTAGFLASTLNITDADFLQGKLNFADTHKNGISNAGTISSTGDIVLIAPNIENSGVIKTDGGSITLVAGQKVTLTSLSNPAVQIEIKAPDNAAVNLGTLSSAGGAIGMFASSLKHSGEINASSLVAGPGGQVVLQASDSVALDAGSTIKADGFDTGNGGSVRVLSDVSTQVNGQITARGGANGGNGGFIETSGESLAIANGVNISTSAEHGLVGTWLIDPISFYVSASGGDISGATLSRNLGNGNVVIQSSAGSTVGSGDIYVNDSVSWSSNNLQFVAAHNIVINSALNATGTSTLTLNTATANGTDAAVAGGSLIMGFGGSGASGSFAGHIDFDRTGSGILNINGTNYTLINNITALQNIGNAVSGSYAIASNFSSNAASFIPIGSSLNPFTGTLEGLGHTVNGLSIQQVAGSNLAMFSVVSPTGRIANLGLTHFYLNGRSNLGSIAVTNQGNIANVFTLGGIDMNGSTGGGLVVNNQGNISNSFTSLNFTSVNVGAGLGGVAYNNTGTIDSSYAMGLINGGSYTGGLVGYNTGTISNSYSAANIVSYANFGNYVGGLVAYNTGSIQSSYATGYVVNSSQPLSYVGGLVGYNTGTVSKSFATGGGRGTSYVGGLVGQNTGTISLSYASGQASGSSFIGGLVGSESSTASVSNSYAIGGAFGTATQTTVGQFIGQNNSPSGSIVASYVLIDPGTTATAVGAGANSSGLTVLSHGQFLDQASFNGLNFNTVWYVGSGKGPKLLGVGPQDTVIPDVWTGLAGDGLWSTPGNWSLHRVPLASDAALFLYLDPVTIMGVVNVQSITATSPITLMGSGSILNVGSSATFNSNINLSANTVLDVSGSLYLGGSLNFNNGSLTLNAGTFNLPPFALQGNGTINISSTATWVGSLYNNVILPQQFNNAGTVQVSGGNLTLSGGGNQSGVFNVASGATLNFSGGTHNFTDGSQFTGTGSFVSSTGVSQLTGTGTGLAIAAGSTLDLVAFPLGGTGVLTNAGTVTGNGATLGGVLMNNGIAQLTNSTLTGGFTNNAGGSLSVSGNVIAGGAASTIAGGTVDLIGGATLTKNAGTLDWNGGTVAGVGTLAFSNGGLIAFSGNGDRVMNSAGLNFNFSDFNLPAGSLTLQQGQLTFDTTGTNLNLLPVGTNLTLQGGTLTNNGPLSIAGTFNINGGTYAGTGSLLMAGGTLNRSGGVWSSSGTLTNTGAINLGSGSYTSPIINQGAMTIAGASFSGLFTNQSTLNASGTNSFTGGLSLASGSQINGAAGTALNVTTAPLTATGAVAVTGTSLNLSAGGNLNAAALTLDAASVLAMNGGTFNFTGANSIAGAGTTQLGAATYAGAGSLNLGGNAITTGAFTFAPTLTNTGTFTVANNVTFSNTLNNSGSLILSNGVTLSTPSGFTQTAGVTELGTAAGTSANFNAGTGFVMNGGTLAGTGIVTGNLNVGAATVAPGFSPGALTVVGNMTLSPTSVTAMQLAGTAPGQYDTITVTGNAALAGALNVSYYGTYASSNNGDVFPLFSFGSTSGSFNSTALPSANYAMAYSALAGTLNFTASAVSPPGVTSTNTGANPVANTGDNNGILIASAQANSSNSLLSLLSGSAAAIDSMYATDLVFVDGNVQLLSANNASVEQCK